MIFDYESQRATSFEEYKDDETGELKEFSLNVLNGAEINIDDFEISNIEIQDKQLELVPTIIREFFKEKATGFRITTTHNIKNEAGEEKKFKLMFENESLGTKNLFILTPILFQVLKKGGVLIVDELDKSLHPFLVKYIVKFLL